MKRFFFALLVCLALSGTAKANSPWNGYCSLQNSFSRVTGCTVEVFLAGTNTDATIFSNSSGTPLANPFTANMTSGLITFYAANGAYDVRLSGGSPSISPAYTIAGQVLFDFSTVAGDGASLFSLNQTIGAVLVGGTQIGLDSSGSPTKFQLPLAFYTNSITSYSASPALSGYLRLATGDQNCWRNFANTADLCIAKNNSDVLSFSGNPFAYVNTNNAFTGNNTHTGTESFVTATFSTSAQSPIFSTSSANPAASGIFRCASSDPCMVFRNNANSADVAFSKNASDQPTFGASIVPTISGTVTPGDIVTFLNGGQIQDGGVPFVPPTPVMGVLSANVPLTISTATALTTAAVSITMPSTGCAAFRVVTEGSVMVTGGGTPPVYMKAWVQDNAGAGHTWNGYSNGTSTGNVTYVSLPLNNTSPVTYVPGATIIFTPYAEINQSSQNAIMTDQFSGSGTWIKARVICSN